MSKDFRSRNGECRISNACDKAHQYKPPEEDQHDCVQIGLRDHRVDARIFKWTVNESCLEINNENLRDLQMSDRFELWF